MKTALVKCQRNYLHVWSKIVNEGGGGQKYSKFCQRSLWMATKMNRFKNRQDFASVEKEQDSGPFLLLVIFSE